MNRKAADGDVFSPSEVLAETSTATTPIVRPDRITIRIGIVDAGPLGGLFGSKLAGTDIDVVLIDTWNEHVSTINEAGLRIRTPGGARSSGNQYSQRVARGTCYCVIRDEIDVGYLSLPLR